MWKHFKGEICWKSSGTLQGSIWWLSNTPVSMDISLQYTQLKAATLLSSGKTESCSQIETKRSRNWYYLQKFCSIQCFSRITTFLIRNCVWFPIFFVIKNSFKNSLLLVTGWNQKFCCLESICISLCFSYCWLKQFRNNSLIINFYFSGKPSLILNSYVKGWCK